MGEFSAQWLSLREPVDHAARSQRVCQTMLQDLRQRKGQTLDGVRVLDLGCGSGSNLRALAPVLGDNQHWTLVDYDEGLLEAASQALQDWAQAVISINDQTLVLQQAGLTLTVTLRRADLSRDLAALMALPVDLVTASALFDLVSSKWVDQFAAALQAPLYAVLSFDGQMNWEPQRELDAAVVQAFCTHQQQDKGFGQALGPNSGRYLARALGDQGFEVTSDKSPWDVQSLPSAFHDMLIDGIASAAADIGDIEPDALDQWLQSRRVAQRCIIGHDDLYATRN